MTRCSRAALAAFALPFAFVAACSSAPPFDAAAMVRDWAQYMQKDYVLRPGDRLAISVYQQPDLTQETVVAPNGSVSLRRIPDPLPAAGVTVGSFRTLVQQRYAEVPVEHAEVSVSLVEASAKSVYVAGEVQKPGVVPYVTGMTLSQALAAAGGFLITADDDDVRVLRNQPMAGPHTYRVNVEQTLYESGPDFLLLPGDVVFAQTSGIADVGNWVELYIRRVLPFQITGFSVPTGGTLQ